MANDEEAIEGLTISGAPGRNGKYLYLQRGSVLTAVARFRGEAEAELFIDWCRQMNGRRLKWDGSTGAEG